ncbi:hypothetical protein HYPSUDRAFT_65167 [Hypholoma sublateritium FD-334 SS-4]|uniref:Uncharacterized protein n=1 Tax=Hypholoma sublateritium (strain FD-334 SS-4) TaxID=945553 RepID=A0A0D2MLU6_HYPSF|nr:hypothetical protein HYPSUDRAFT_65167 [Hypholoma sublateritium FD-334 SS-4]
MFRAIFRRPPNTSSATLKGLRLACSFSTTRPTRQLSPSVGRRPPLHRCSQLKGMVKRTYATTEDAPFPHKETAHSEEVPHDAWVAILENTVSAPWLGVRPHTPERILERAFTLILQILLSLNMPRDPEAAQAFFFAFENAPVSPDSDIGRARRAIATLARIVIDDITSIPENSLLRKEHPNIFALHGALVPLVDLHLRDPSGSVGDWKAFWTRAESPIFELNTELHNSGFGKDLDELMEAAKNEEKNEQEGGRPK